MANWYLFRDGQTYGPYPEQQVEDWIRAGQVSAADKLCREGDRHWASADLLPEFAGLVMPGGPPKAYAPGAKDKTVAAVLALVPLTGPLGIHHFYLGNIGIGIIYILLSCTGLSYILGMVDGIMYLVKPEDQFQRNYRNWFCNGT